MRVPGCKAGDDRPGGTSGVGVGLSRRGALAGGAAMVAAAGGLGGCAARREAEAGAAPVRPEDTPLGRLIAGTPGPAVAGEPLDVAALRGFYARRGFQPVWFGREEQADVLAAAVLRAGGHGLDPELFHGGLLQRRYAFPPLRRDLLLTDSFLRYAGALAHGAVPPLRRKSVEALAPRPVDVAAVLDEAVGSRDPVALIEALAPATPTYKALREALRAPAPPRPARFGRAAVAAAEAAAARVRAIEANLERERWLPRPLPAERVWVNVPDQQLTLFLGSEAVFSTRVVVGDSSERNQSPEFHALIEASFFNPPWVVPRDIVEAELLPRIAREPDYLARNNMVMRDNGEVEQLPGPTAGLGYILFDMPNRFDVYLHDTPDRFLFSRGNRRMSRGCIRVQKPRELAALLMRQPVDAIDEKIALGDTVRAALPAPVPVFVAYQTAFADAEGAVQFRPDFYDRDGDVWRRLQKAQAGQGG